MKTLIVGGAGFVGIAVALMGRGRPLGIVLSALLLGALQQGGSELALSFRQIDRDLVVVIQGLIILCAGAFEPAFRPLAVRLVGAGMRLEPRPRPRAGAAAGEGGAHG